jgi:DNA-binding response OmpR family regulator
MQPNGFRPMHKILIAEDDLLTSRLVGFKLQQQGFTVLNAQDGETALSLAQSEKPDLILLDCMMPGMDGFAVLRSLKESKELQATPVIMLTFRSKDSDVINALDLGAADYIVKPFSPSELMARIRKVLRLGGPASGETTSQNR